MNRRNIRHDFQDSGIADSQIESYDCGGPNSLNNAIKTFDPFQRWEHTELEYVQEEMRDRDRVMDERAYEDRARWGHD